MHRDEVDLHHPPKGAWFWRNAQGFELGSTLRSGAAFFMVPFMTAFSAFEIFIAYALRRQKLDLTLMLAGFLFLVFTLFFWVLALLTVCGKLAITVNGAEGKIFAGVGPLGRTRKFKWNEVREVRVGTYTSPKQNRYKCIVLEGDKRLSLGAGVKGPRLKFMVAALDEMLRAR